MTESIRILSVDDILSANDLTEETVHIPEWGGSVRVRSLTKAQNQRLRKACTTGGKFDEDRFELLMFVHSVVEPQIPEDAVELLKEKNAAAIDRVNKVVLQMNGLTDSAVKDAERTFRQE